MVDEGECQECGHPGGGHNLGCRIHHRIALDEIARLQAENEKLRAALKQAVAYADAVAREDGMPEGKQCKRLAVQEVSLTGKLGGRPVVEFDVAAARAAMGVSNEQNASREK